MIPACTSTSFRASIRASPTRARSSGSTRRPSTSRADFTIGNGPRTHPSLRNPGNQNHDLSLAKRFALAGRPRRSSSAPSGFNFLNHANWNDPDTMIGPASAPNVNAGKIIGSRGGRVMQLGLRFSF